MAIDIPLELDSGPITWVKAEIDSALYRALESIEKLRSAPSAELRNAVRSDLHQVAGAFELVGIEGLAVLVQEFERHFSSDVESVPKEALDLVDRGCRRLWQNCLPCRIFCDCFFVGHLGSTRVSG